MIHTFPLGTVDNCGIGLERRSEVVEHPNL